MAINKTAYYRIKQELEEKKATLVAVSKTKPVSDILALYDLGHRDFGENYVQELVAKHKQLPSDIRWHFIGHLQRNKVKEIVPFVHLIQGTDSLKLLTEINKQAIHGERTVGVLLQVHIAREDTKFGLDEKELEEIISQKDRFSNINIRGLMGMASLTEDEQIIREEFRRLKTLQKRFIPYDADNPLPVLSMGMSSDYAIALEEGSTMIRIGSLLFGSRN